MERQQIDGMYTLATLDRFWNDLQHAACLRGLLPRKDDLGLLRPAQLRNFGYAV